MKTDNVNFAEIHQKAAELGIDLTRLDGEESSYEEDLALLYIIEGKEIPVDIVKKLKK